MKLLSPALRLTLISFVIVISGVVGSGRWVSQQIQAEVIHETSATMALYVDSFIAPHLQELGRSPSLTADKLSTLNNLLKDTDSRDRIVAFLVWDVDRNRVLYSNIPALIGQGSEKIEEDRVRARQGEVTSDISALDDAETVVFNTGGARLLETHIPVRLRGTDQVIAVVEFYQAVDKLEAEIAARQREGWLAVSATATVIYLVLVGYVRWANKTQKDQVEQLTELLAQNEELHNRVRRATARVTTLNEQWLRRISAELHDGPAQSIGLAAMRLDFVIGQSEKPPAECVNCLECQEHLPSIQSYLSHALQELRDIVGGLGLPQLEGLTLADTVSRAVHTHELRTGTKVALDSGSFPEQAPLPVKITTYRFIQEALNNAYRHAGGTGQQVRVRGDAGQLSIEVMDQGPGFDTDQAVNLDDHFGLAGMRERVQSLGGSFYIESEINRGTKVIARLPLQTEQGRDER